MKKLIFPLLLLSFQILFAQKSELKYNNNLEYKFDLIEKEIKGLTEIQNCPNCQSIKTCIEYFIFGTTKEEKEVLILRMKELARKYIENHEVLLLTYGTNGNGGLGFSNLDKKTKKFEFLFVSVNNSCIIGDLDEAVEAFNEESIKHLNKKYGKSWRKVLKGKNKKNFKK